MRKIAMVLVVLLMILTIAGCSQDSNGGKVEEVGEVMFTGSSTLAPVLTELANKFIEENETWDNVDESFPKEDISIVINGGGSGAGIKAAIEKTANFGMASKNVDEESKGMFDEYKEYKLGTDALTLAVNPENKIYEYQDGFTTAQLQKIFSGEYKYWDEMNENLDHEEIVVVTRDIGGGAHEVFQKRVMGDIEVSQDVIQSPSMGALVTKIIENKNAIGYASFGVVNQNDGKIIPMKVDGVEPTKENIIGGSYKVSRPLLVLKNGDLSAQEQAFIDYLVSDDGMKVVEELGFVPES